MSSPAAASGAAAPPSVISATPTYAYDPHFFKRFTHLQLLHTPLHHQESPASPRVPFTPDSPATATASAGEPPLPELEAGEAAAGHFGVVFAARDATTGAKVAIKFSKEQWTGSRWENPYVDEREQVLEEVYTHAAASQLPCASILKLLYACEVEVDLARYLPTAQAGALRRHAFVMEYASGHRLQDVLANHETIGTLARVEPASSGAGGGAGATAASPPADRRPYLEKDKRDLFRQILEALAALHGAGITHRDLKPENIMLRHAPVVRAEDLHDLRAAQRDIKLDLAVFDFGLAIDAARGDVRAQPRAPPNFVGNIGSAYYLPPEVLSRYGTPKTPQDTPYAPPMDMWAAGVTLYLMMLGDSHCDRDSSPGMAGTWDAATGALRSTWDTYRENLLPFAFTTQRINVAAWGRAGQGQRQRLLVPRLRCLPLAAGAPPPEPMEAALCAEHHRRSLLLSPPVRHLLQRLLEPSPALRITAQEALQHPWFAATPAQLHSAAMPEELALAALRQAQVLRESRAGRLRFVVSFKCLTRMRTRLARARRALTLAAQRRALDSAAVQRVLACFKRLEVERRASSGCGGGGGGGGAHFAPSIHLDRGVTRAGLAQVLLESGVAEGVVGGILEALWRELADEASGLVKEHEFLTLLPLLSDPPAVLDGTLALYFELWDVNSDGYLVEEELVTLMEAVQGLLPEEASEADMADAHLRMVLQAREHMMRQPDHRITKEAFIQAFKNHREPVASMVVPLQRLH